MSALMQILGGIFYLLNKIFFSFAEHSEKKNQIFSKWRIWSWVVYLVGLPAWLVIFVWERNWIAFALEAGGSPAMILGLIIAIRGKGNEPKLLHCVAIISIVIGLGYSLYDFGGLTSINQVAEIAMTTGFLIGTYQLAQKKLSGYLWYMIMHIACVWLMYLDDYPWLIAQQIVSLIFIVDAYITKKKD